MSLSELLKRSTENCPQILSFLYFLETPDNRTLSGTFFFFGELAALEVEEAAENSEMHKYIILVKI